MIIGSKFLRMSESKLELKVTEILRVQYTTHLCSLHTHADKEAQFIPICRESERKVQSIVQYGCFCVVIDQNII